MRLDVVIPTFNRASLLPRTLESLATARVPAGLDARVVVVDNNSKDDTPAVVESFRPRFGGRLRYVFEGRPGRSNALNAGIAAVDGDLVGMIDDDEEVDAEWFAEVARAFADPTLDFITGPYHPRWGAPAPSWLPHRPSSVIGWVDGGPEVRTFGRDYDGVLMGGNAVVRLARLREVGAYDPALGRTSDGSLLSCEDEEMQHRLMAAGAHGQYRPGLIIYHYIPPERLTKRYHRRWAFGHGVSSGVLGRSRRESVPYLLGAPRHRVGRLARDLLWTAPGYLGVGPLRSAHARFDARMHALDLAGYWYGRWRTPRAASAPPSGSAATPAAATATPRPGAG
jgi:glycosyltransferase involved in cell wall biosynthesis